MSFDSWHNSQNLQTSTLIKSNSNTEAAEGGAAETVLIKYIFTLITSIFSSLSVYSPIIIVMCVFFMSITSTSENSFLKPFVYLVWFFLATGFRQLIKLFTKSGQSDSFNGFYSTYILSFTFFYLLFPLILVNIDAKSSLFNWKSIIFFSLYIIYDISFKVSQLTLGVSNWPLVMEIMGELFSGSAIGIAFSSIMYYIGQGLLYINEMSSNGTVTKVATSQQMKCRVYKNGELIGTQTSEQ